MKWYFTVAGGHTHVRVFMNGGKCGDLCFRNEEFNQLRPTLSQVMFINETPSLKPKEDDAPLSERDKAIQVEIEQSKRAHLSSSHRHDVSPFHPEPSVFPNCNVCGKPLRKGELAVGACVDCIEEEVV